jgi:hypothetical protein
MRESDKPFSACHIEMGVGRDVGRPILSGVFLPLFLLVIFMPSLVLVFKAPEMKMLIHRSSLAVLLSKNIVPEGREAGYQGGELFSSSIKLPRRD